MSRPSPKPRTWVQRLNLLLTVLSAHRELIRLILSVSVTLVGLLLAS